MKNIIPIILLIGLLTACNSRKHFTSRKYTSGRYLSHASHKGRINKENGESGKLVVVKNNVTEKTSDVIKKAENEKVILANVDVPVSVNNRNLDKTTIFSIKKVEQVQKNKVNQIFHKKTFKKLPLKIAQKSAPRPGTKSLISVILSGLGLLIDIAVFVLAVASLEYLFLVLFAAGLTFGIIGLIMGIQGVKEYKTEKNNGNRDKNILILGIVGASVGLAAIIAAVALCFYAAIFISIGGF